MIQNNIEVKQKDHGFTIVELLVVIVVIGILAAITIVSYTGITTRAKTTQAQSNANSVMQVVTAYASDNNGGNGSFPATISDITTYNTNANGVAKLPAGLSLTNATTSVFPASADAQTTIYYLKKGTPATGGCIGYWDPQAGAPAYLKVGDAATAVMTSSSASCT